MLSQRVALLLLWAHATCGTKYLSSIAGRYLVVSEKAHDCEIGEHGYDGTKRHNVRWTPWNPVRRYDRQLLNGNITLSLPFNDSYWLNDTYASRSNNMWKDNALVFTEKKNACSILRRSLPALYSHLMGDKFNDTTCVLDAGVYEYHDFNVDLRLHYYPQLHYGVYRELKMTGIGNWVAECVYFIKHFLPAAQDAT